MHIYGIKQGLIESCESYLQIFLSLCLQSVSKTDPHKRFMLFIILKRKMGKIGKTIFSSGNPQF